MKKENKKKVVTLSAMAALLAVVLGMGGKTYAKYFSSANNPAQTATVAKWGFVVNANADGFFPGSAEDKTTVSTAIVDAEGNVIVRQGTPGINVIAPGDEGFMTFGVNGQAEVKSTLTFDVEDDYSEIQLLTGGSTVTYSPMKWTLSTSADLSSYTAVSGYENVTLEEIVGYLEGASVSGTRDAGQQLNFNFKLSWAWAFEGNDDYDTALGLIADGKTSDPRVATPGYTANLDVKFGITIKVEQAA